MDLISLFVLDDAIFFSNIGVAITVIKVFITLIAGSGNL